MLRSLGLRVAIDHSTAYLSLTPAWVARLTPSVGTRVSVGTVVTITPSGLVTRGSPAVLKSHPRYRVPSFIGRTAALFAAYRVTSQAPRPGRMIVQGIMIGEGFKPTPLTLALQP
jgi:hypothetical protein